MHRIKMFLYAVIFFVFTATLFFADNYPGMRVIDRYLYTKDNEKVILRGVNQMIIWLDKAGSTSYREIAKTGANSVRIVWLTSGKADELDTAITNCVKENMIPLIEVHDATCEWSKLNECVEYWIRADIIRVIQKHEKYLLLNIGNEIGNSSVPADAFESVYKNAIIKMRSAGIHVPLFIDSVDCGKNIDVFQEKGFNLIAADPDHNLMFSIHMWWPLMYNYDEEKVKNEIAETAGMRLPLIVGEFGNEWEQTEAGAIPYLTIIEECEKNEIGWLAWSWGPGNKPQTWLDMSTEGTFATLHGWGLELAVTHKYSIKNTSKRPFSFGGTVMPEKTPDPDSWKKNKEAYITTKDADLITGGILNAVKAKKKIKIDGKLNDWDIAEMNAASSIRLNKNNGYIKAGKIGSADDFDAVVYARYNDKNLYLAVQVTDDNLVLENKYDNNWRNDGLEIWIDGANDKGTMTDNGGDDPDNYQLDVDANGNRWIYRNNNANALLEKIKAVSRIDKTNYIIEVQIPFASVPEFKLKKSNKMGLNISIIDADKITKPEWNQILWQGKMENNPAQWGSLILK